MVSGLQLTKEASVARVKTAFTIWLESRSDLPFHKWAAPEGFDWKRPETYPETYPDAVSRAPVGPAGQKLTRDMSASSG